MVGIGSVHWDSANPFKVLIHYYRSVFMPSSATHTANRPTPPPHALTRSQNPNTQPTATFHSYSKA
jgi:hypothetical protein